MPLRTIAARLSPVMSSPWKSTLPLSGTMAPDIRLKKVLLPAPFGPITAVSVPCVNFRLTSLVAATPPKRLIRF